MRGKTLECGNPMDYDWVVQTIVELPEFKKRASSRLSVEEKASVINYLAAHPAAGDIIRETGGLRKLRWAAKGKGKSGGVRVIYYYHNEEIPLFLLTLFSKGEKANLTKAERNDLAKLTELLKSTYGGSHE